MNSRINTWQAARRPNDRIQCIPTLSPTFGNIEIEEVAVEDGLYHPRDHSNLVIELLGVVAPDPVGDIEGSIEAQEEKVMRCDGLCFPCLADHEELREDSYRLQVDGEGPEYL